MKCTCIRMVIVISCVCEYGIFLYCIGATLEIITDRSQEGAQFVKGFGGIGGMSA